MIIIIITWAPISGPNPPTRNNPAPFEHQLVKNGMRGKKKREHVENNGLLDTDQ